MQYWREFQRISVSFHFTAFHMISHILVTPVLLGGLDSCIILLT